MTKALSSYPKDLRKKIAENRILKAWGGLGFWAAKDFFLPHSKKVNKDEKKKVADKWADC